MTRSDKGGGGASVVPFSAEPETPSSVKSFSEENIKFIFGEMKNMSAARTLCLCFGLVAEPTVARWYVDLL
jgi:hypothetical protein